MASGFGHLPFGRALFLEFVWDTVTEGGRWLRELSKVAEITHGAPEDVPGRAATVAFTWSGLRRMKLDARALASFSRPFREGMFQEDRLRRLGDRRNRKWLETVLEGGPEWSGNIPLRDPTKADGESVGAYSVRHPGANEEDLCTPVTVHALLMLYTCTEPEAENWAGRVTAALQATEVAVVRELDLSLDVGNQGFSREHFGFADALSQPMPFGLSVPKDESGYVQLSGAPAPKDSVQGIPLGEILMGYQNGHSEPAPGPVVAAMRDEDPNTIDPRVTRAELAAHPLAEGFADLGVDGSYLVVRELKQDVAAFWTSLDANAARLKEADPSIGDIDATWLAERIVGRNMDGHLLCPGGTYLPKDQYGGPDSGFRFSESDPRGHGCPLGSHIRRAFPRDALAPDPLSRDGLLQSGNNHRILRRGRKYGPKIVNCREDDHEDRGLLFMCLNTDIERQFEFVQQTWLLNTTFATLFKESDPLVGPAGPFTIPQDPLRRTVRVQTYVKMAGGEYFFLPSMPALAYLAEL